MSHKLRLGHGLLEVLLCIVTMTLPQLLQAQTSWIDLGNVTLNPGAVSSVATGLYGNVFAATNFADANGYYYIARYNAAGGGQWTELGNLKANNPANVVITDNAGNIYTAGQFTDSSGYYYVAKWDIWHWVELGGVSSLHANGQINALATDAAGNLYAAGQFTDANGYYYVAKWNGTSWGEVGGVSSNALKANGYIYAITADALGNIYTGGVFTDSISPYAGNYYVAQFNGTGWGKAGAQHFMGGGIYALAADNTGNVYASGDLNDTTGYGYVAQWNATGGGAWNELGGYSLLATSNLNALAVDSAGNVYTAGELGLLSYNSGVAMWNGTQWLALDSGSSAMNFGGGVNSLCIGATGKVYAGGDLINAQSMTFIAQWNGTVWDALGNNTNPGNYDGTVYNIITDIHGNLYGVGGFSEFGNQYAVKWDGVAWSYLTAGTSAFSGWGMNALATDATANVYAAGYITDGYGYNCVAKWDGTNWTELGTGSHALNPNSTINCIASDAEGKIYAGGSFTDSTGHYYIAKWDGTNWTELGGAPGYFTSPVTSVACNNAGTVYATGGFTDSYGHYYIAYWNGTAWAELGGVSGGNALNANNTINALTIDAAGNVYAAGNFTDGSGYKYVAKWNGTSWAALSASANPLRASAAISTLTADIAGNIYAAGLIADTAIAYVVKWDGTNWLKLGTGFTTGQVNTTTTDIYGNIYAAGTFTDNTGHVYVGEYLASNTGALGLVPPNLINRVANSAYIFEGQVIQSVPYWTAGHGSIYTVHLIQLSKVLKDTSGQISCGTVEIITLGGRIGDTIITYSENQTFVPGQTGIFMCNPTQLDTPTTGTVSPDNTGAMQLSFGQNSFIAYYNDGVNAPALDMWRTYDSLPLLYAAVQQFVSYSYTTCEPEEHIIMNKFMPNQYTEILKKKMAQQKAGNTLNLGMAKSIPGNKSSASIHHKGGIRSGYDLYYFFGIGRVTTSGGNYVYSIDINASDYSNDSTWFLGGHLSIEYDTTIFGAYLASYYGASVSKSDRFGNYDISIQDDGPSTLGIDLSLYNTSDTNLSPSGDFEHLEMIIENCASPITLTIDSGIGYYTLTDHSADSMTYDNIFGSTFSDGSVSCAPHITSFTPTQVNAGVGDIVTVSGVNFGSTQGNGGVFLTNADEPSGEIKIDTIDMVAWSNNEIQFKVPSITDSFILQHTNYNGTAGTGAITIKTNSGDIITRSTLVVFYAIQNALLLGSPVQKLQNLLVDEYPMTTPDHHGYWLRVDTSISRHADRYGTLKRAVRDWQCLTRVNFQIDTGTYIAAHHSPNQDSICTVTLGSVPYGLNAFTKEYVKLCNTSKAISIVREFDLILNSAMIKQFIFDTTGTYAISPTQIDGYNTFLHELGHAQSLGHILDPTKIMYYQSISPLAANKRLIHLYTDASAHNGGIAIIDTSISNIFNYCPDVWPMVLLRPDTISNCIPYQPLNTGIISSNDVNVKAYPNPVDDNLILKCSAPAVDNYTVKVYTVIGQQVYAGVIKMGEDELTIPVSKWTSGLYIIKLQTNTFSQSFKIIRQ